MSILTNLLGARASDFDFAAWPTVPIMAHTDERWFTELESIEALRSPDVLFDRATRLVSFATLEPLRRADARGRYDTGDSIYVVALEQVDDELRRLCDDLADALYVNRRDVSVQAWAAGGPTSVGLHYDFEANFNVQVRGEKHWQVAANHVVPHPIRSYHASAEHERVSAASGEPLPHEMPRDARRWRASPGDVVYLPHGVFHETRTSGPTLAVAFVVQPPTWGELVVRALLDRLHADPRWRAPLLGARRVALHEELRVTARDALTAARLELERITASEMLFDSLWTGSPATFRRADDVHRPEIVRAGEQSVLRWRRGGQVLESEIPAWAAGVGRFLVSVDGDWSIATLQDLVFADDVPFLGVLVTRLQKHSRWSDSAAVVEVRDDGTELAVVRAGNPASLFDADRRVADAFVQRACDQISGRVAVAVGRNDEHAERREILLHDLSLLDRQVGLEDPVETADAPAVGGDDNVVDAALDRVEHRQGAAAGAVPAPRHGTAIAYVVADERHVVVDQACAHQPADLAGSRGQVFVIAENLDDSGIGPQVQRSRLALRPGRDRFRHAVRVANGAVEDAGDDGALRDGERLRVRDHDRQPRRVKPSRRDLPCEGRQGRRIAEQVFDLVPRDRVAVVTSRVGADVER